MKEGKNKIKRSRKFKVYTQEETTTGNNHLFNRKISKRNTDVEKKKKR